MSNTLLGRVARYCLGRARRTRQKAVDVAKTFARTVRYGLHLLTEGKLYAGQYYLWDTLIRRGKEQLACYRATGEKRCLQDAVQHFRHAVPLASDGVGDVVYTFGSLGNALLIRFKHIGDSIDLDQAFVYHQSTLELTAPAHRFRSSSLLNLADTLLTRFQKLGDRADLNQAILCNQGALELILLDHPLRALNLDNLGTALLTRFEQVGDRSDLEQANIYLRDALDLRPLGHHDRPTSLISLANALKIRFQHVGDLVELDQAIVYYDSALDLIPFGNPLRSSGLLHLAEALHTRFQQVGDHDDLEKAIVSQQDALLMMPPGHSNRSSSLANLVNALRSRFEQSGAHADFDQAIVHHQDALDLTPPGHPQRPSSLIYLANALKARFRHVGARVDLDQALAHHQDALHLTPPGHFLRGVCLINLANSIKTRFQQMRDRTDLDQAIIYYQSALDLRPPGHPDRSVSLNNLAHALKTRFDQGDDRADLDQAIVYYQEALKLRPYGHPDRFATLNNLAEALKTCFEQVGSRADLDQAIVHCRSALDLTPPGHPDCTLNLGNLASVLVTRFEQVGDRIDLDQAVIYQQGALDLTPPGHPLRSLGLGNLANTLTIRLAQCSSTEIADLSASTVRNNRNDIIGLLREATSTTTGGPPDACLDASLKWVDIAAQWYDPSAIEAYRISLGLLEAVLLNGRSLESRHLRISSARAQEIRTLAVDGAAFALDAGQIEEAVELLERGRGILFTEAGKYRTRVDELDIIHPALADKFRLMSAKMQSSVMRPAVEYMSPPTPGDVIATYQQLSQQWADVVEEIRALPGFTTFLRPTPFMLLRSAAVSGPIIILNLSQRRTDAIVLLLNGNPCLVPLPNVTPELIRSLLEKIHHKTGDKRFMGLLRVIWNDIVRPIVDVLQNVVHLPSGSRIWWCPTGATSHLPLHAAGDYTKAGQNLPDLYISSYTPTLSTLIRARQKHISKSPDMPNSLIVGQSETPGQIKIPSVPLEVQTVKSSFDNATVLEGPNATKSSVLRAISLHPWVHLACHGHVSQAQPFQSNFSLHDGPLTLLDITSLALPQADFAFLSACHSAEGNRDQPDEVLHLTAAMQFAGFRTVVGTLWAVCDFDGPIITDSFYSSLFGTHCKPVAESSAHALHRAVGELRQRGVSSSRWACFVHFGC